MPMKKDRQYRSLNLQTRKKEAEEGKSYLISGYATTFEPYVLYEDEEGAIYESFSADCFKNCDMSDVIFQVNHEGMVFARQSNGTLELSVDEHGLKVDGDLGSTNASRDVYDAIDTGLLTKMSWGFLPGEYYFERKTRTIVHTSVRKIFDVSAVSIPANNDTEINARSFADGEIRKMVEEFNRAEKSKKALELKLKLAGF